MPTRARQYAAPARRKAGRGRAFTLVEMLVVTGIIVSMLAIILPAVGAAWRTGVRTRMSLDLQTIATGLEAYRSDHNTYPIVYGTGSTPVTETNGSIVMTGAAVLGATMIAPSANDGSAAPGTTGISFGFRTRKAPGDTGVQQGKLYGPYVPPERFRTGVSFELLDRNKKPILYYAGRPNANIQNPSAGYLRKATYGGLPNTMPMFNGNDNEAFVKTEHIQAALGDVNFNGAIDGTEGAAFTGAYLLWSAGPDEEFGAKKDKTKPLSPKNKCDDVGNFQRGEY